MARSERSGSYEVGYKKPPKHTRFKKGQSGNPKGRPKGSRNFSTDVKATLSQSVRVTEGGKAKTISTQLATLLRLREAALRCDARALDRLLELAGRYNDEVSIETREIGDSDAKILEAYETRLLRRAGGTHRTLEDHSPELVAPKAEVQANQVLDGRQDAAQADEEDDDAWLR